MKDIKTPWIYQGKVENLRLSRLMRDPEGRLQGCIVFIKLANGFFVMESTSDPVRSARIRENNSIKINELSLSVDFVLVTVPLGDDYKHLKERLLQILANFQVPKTEFFNISEEILTEIVLDLVKKLVEIRYRFENSMENWGEMLGAKIREIRSIKHAVEVSHYEISEISQQILLDGLRECVLTAKAIENRLTEIDNNMKLNKK